MRKQSRRLQCPRITHFLTRRSASRESTCKHAVKDCSRATAHWYQRIHLRSVDCSRATAHWYKWSSGSRTIRFKTCIKRVTLSSLPDDANSAHGAPNSKLDCIKNAKCVNCPKIAELGSRRQLAQDENLSACRIIVHTIQTRLSRTGHAPRE